jgi:pimeloyl-ACP methyl ester carboxylesterase
MTGEQCRKILDCVSRTGDDEPGSWSAAWLDAGDEALQAGDPLNACRRYNLARFPFPETAGQRAAAHRCVAAFEQWRQTQRGIERRELRLLGEKVPVWASGLDTTARKPLLLVLGGIVSIKEQWAQFLVSARKLGMAVVVAEMPGVGENPLRYQADSENMLAALADAVAELTPIEGVYAVAMSFGGTMAMRWAAVDPRVRGVVTVGAPVSGFFTDRARWQRVPETTKRTLAHVTGLPAGKLPHALPEFGMTPDQLRKVAIPVHYVRSKRDEIVPAGDSDLLAAALPRFSRIDFNDVHGSPAHLTDTKLWIVRSLLDMNAGPRLPKATLGVLLNLRAVRRSLTSLWSMS